MNVIKETLAVLAVGTALGFGAGPAVSLVADPAVAAALPGDSVGGCEIPSSADSCEGPIRPDGSRMRCSYSAQYVTGGTLIPQIKSCNIMPPGAPDQPH